MRPRHQRLVGVKALCSSTNAGQPGKQDYNGHEICWRSLEIVNPTFLHFRSELMLSSDHTIDQLGQNDRPEADNHVKVL